MCLYSISLFCQCSSVNIACKVTYFVATSMNVVLFWKLMQFFGLKKKIAWATAFMWFCEHYHSVYSSVLQWALSALYFVWRSREWNSILFSQLRMKAFCTDVRKSLQSDKTLCNNLLARSLFLSLRWRWRQ